MFRFLRSMVLPLTVFSAVVGLSGCVVYPYDDGYYHHGGEHFHHGYYPHHGYYRR